MLFKKKGEKKMMVKAWKKEPQLSCDLEEGALFGEACVLGLLLLSYFQNIT